MDATIRLAAPPDAEACGRIIYHAFKDIADRHQFPSGFPTLEAATTMAHTFINQPLIFGVIAENCGQIIGCNFLDERDPILGLGPFAVEPEAQQLGVGRQLMIAVLERGQGSAGIRLTQEAFNVSSMSLYASLGFEVKEPLLLMWGKFKSSLPSNVEVRPLKSEDVDECAALCKKVHGIDRTNELRDAVKNLSPFVALRTGRIRAYASAMNFCTFNHGVAETEKDMRALLLGAGALSVESLSFLLPTRQASFFRWCLSEGMRAVSPRTLMAMGEYHEPEGCYFPSLVY